MFFLSPHAYPWDIAIAMILAGSFSLAIAASAALRPGQKGTLRRFAVSLALLLSCCVFFLTAYGTFVEPKLLTVTQASVPLRTDRPLRIVLLADLHVGAYVQASDTERVVRRVNGLFPDLILIAGDFVASDNLDARTFSSLSPLKDLRSSYGTFAVLGNHDHGVYRTFFGVYRAPEDRSETIAEFLRSLNMTVLVNASENVTVGTDTVTIAGVDDAWSGKADLLRTLQERPAGVPTILLSHNPDVILDPLSREADLIVSGHTHGGQIRLPWIGSLATLPTRLGPAFDQGIFALGRERTLVITRGIGELGPRARLFAPPQIMLLTTEPPPGFASPFDTATGGTMSSRQL